MSAVLIVEDQVSLLHTLDENLRRGGYDVEVVTTGVQALACTEQHLADAVILDLGLPDMGGMQVLNRIRNWSDVPVIVLSARTAEIQKIAALDAGADDYVTKPFDMDELMARLRVALRDRRRGLDDPVVVTEDFTIDLAGQQVTRDGRVIRLTRTEWRIVALLARHPGRLITQRQLLADIWGTKESRGNNYLRVFLVTIRRKLEPDPVHPRYFITEPGCGVRFWPGARPALPPAPALNEPV